MLSWSILTKRTAPQLTCGCVLAQDRAMTPTSWTTAPQMARSHFTNARAIGATCMPTAPGPDHDDRYAIAHVGGRRASPGRGQIKASHGRGAHAARRVVDLL